MEPLQMQTTAQVIKNQFIIQITSGCDILLESNFKCIEDDVNTDWIISEILRAFTHALAVKMKGGE